MHRILVESGGIWWIVDSLPSLARTQYLYWGNLRNHIEDESTSLFKCNFSTCINIYMYHLVSTSFYFHLVLQSIMQWLLTRPPVFAQFTQCAHYFPSQISTPWAVLHSDMLDNGFVSIGGVFVFWECYLSTQRRDAAWQVTRIPTGSVPAALLRWCVQESMGTEAEKIWKPKDIFCASVDSFTSIYTCQVSHHFQCTRTWRGHVRISSSFVEWNSPCMAWWSLMFGRRKHFASWESISSCHNDLQCEFWRQRYQQIFPVWTIAVDYQDACSNGLSCKIGIERDWKRLKVQTCADCCQLQVTKVTKNQRQLATATSDNRINLWSGSPVSPSKSPVAPGPRQHQISMCLGAW